MNPQREVMEMFYDEKGKPINRPLHLGHILNRAKFGEYMVTACLRMLVHRDYLKDMGKGYYSLTKTGHRAMRKGWC